MSKRKNSLSQNFVKHGYIISDIESVKDFTKIENEVFKTIKNHLKIKKNLKRDYLFNNLHSFLNIKELNKLRLKIYRSLNSKGWFKEAYFSLASQTINNIVGNELAILLPSPCRKLDSILPKEPVDVADPLIFELAAKSIPLLKLPLISEAI